MDLNPEARVWYVREGEYYVFHLEPPLDNDIELLACLSKTDERYLRIRQALGHGHISIKEREQLVKANYWIYAESALADADLPPGCQRMAYGTVTPAGIVFAQRGMHWDDVVDEMTHEEIHLWWAREVGDAPSLLTEGVAVYFTTKAQRAHSLRDLCVFVVK